jgi:hypothetical protein
LAFLSGSHAFAQESIGSKFSERLLEILTDRNVLDAAEAEVLRQDARLGLLIGGREERLRVRDVEQRINALAEEREDTTGMTRDGSSWRLTGVDPTFRLEISGRLQVGFVQDFTRRDPEVRNEDQPDFEVFRARLTFEGRAFRDWMRFSVAFDIEGDPTETGIPFGLETQNFDSRNRLASMADAYLRFAFLDEFEIYVGQMKVPYSRQYLTSSGKQEFVDRSTLRSTFVPGRDVGLMIAGELGDDESFFAEYQLGVFDGEGSNFTNDDKGLMVAGRFAVHPFGEAPYTEGGLHGHEGFLLALGVNGWLHQDDQHLSERDDWAVGTDLAIFWGPFSVLAELHYHERGRRRVDRRAVGWLLQLGYMIVPDKFQIALRGAEHSWDASQTDASRREYLLGLNYYFDGHSFKLQADFGWVEEHEHDHIFNRDGWRFRLQLQVNF